ncbi:MAG: FAD-dependent oxidoreductase, partial [Holdemania filiformis]
MKKLVALTLASLMLLAGCSSTPKNDGNEATPTPEAAATEADVIVVGAGGAGMTAAIEAVNAGKSVIVIEKAAMTGGNTTRSTGGMNAANTPEQDLIEFAEEAGVEKMLASAKENYPDLAELTATVEKQYEEYKANPTGYFDTEELFMLDTLVGGKNLNDHALVEVLANEAKNGIEWLKTIDANLSQVGSFGGASVKRIHKPVNDEGKTVAVGSYLVPKLTKAAEDKGVQFVMETAATELVVTDGKVTGVKAGDTTYTGKAVILATGGFAANTEMVLKYKPSYEGFVCTNAPGMTGDGIVMATAIGADTVDMEQIQI